MSSEEAPEGLARVQAFVNSVELPDGPDALATTASAAAWLRDQGFRPGALSGSDLRRLQDAREALRDALEAHTGEDVDERTGARLKECFGTTSLVPVVSPGGASLAPACTDGVDCFLADVSAAIVEATYRGTWERLKVCRADSCRWAFYDRSKNGRGHWCSMRVCGTRAKARTYRERRRVTT